MSAEVIGSNNKKEPVTSVSAGKGNVNSVSFTLPSLPGSVNRIYQPGYSIGSERPTWDIAPEWKLWRSQMGVHVPRFTVAPMSIIQVDRIYYHSFFYGNGKWRKYDPSNCDKLLFDLISRKIETDDSRFKCGWMDSRDSQNPRVEITLTEILETDWRVGSERII